MLDAVGCREFIGRLTLVDAIKFAATCQNLRNAHCWLFVSEGPRIDFSRVEMTPSTRRRLTDALVQRVLSHVLPAGGPSSRGGVIGINLKGLTITDEAIKVIAANCPALMELNVAMEGLDWETQYRDVTDDKITNESVLAIAGKCPALTDLTVRNCSNVTTAIKAIR